MKTKSKLVSVAILAASVTFAVAVIRGSNGIVRQK